MKIIDRVKQFIDYKEVSFREFDRIIGTANGYIGLQIKRRASIGGDILETIVSKFPEIDINWLITGTGEMLKLDAKEHLPHTVNSTFTDVEIPYRRLAPRINGVPVDENVRPTVRPTPEYVPKTVFLTPQIITVDREGNENIVHVPVKAAAGYLNGYADPTYIETLPSFSLPGLNNSTYRAFEVSGDSMYPTLENKEMIIGQWVEKLEYIREDRVHILVTKSDGIIVKRLLNRVDKYGYVIAKSDAVNDRNLYPNIEVKPDDILEVWYAVWHGGFNFKSPGDLWKRQNNLEADLSDVLRRLKQAGL